MTDADASTGSPQHDPHDAGLGSVPYGSSSSGYGDTRPYEGRPAAAPQQPYGQQSYGEQPFGGQPYGQASDGHVPYGQPYGQAPMAGTGTHAQQQFGSYAPVPARGLSITSFVLGLVSLVFWFSLVVPIAGLVLGFAGLKREPAGRGLAIAGIVINGAFVLIAVVGIVLAILLFVGLLGTIPFFMEAGGGGLPA